MSENYIQMIAEDKIYPIIRCQDAEFAVQTARALVDGGIRILEMNVEHPSIYSAIKEVSKFAFGESQESLQLKRDILNILSQEKANAKNKKK